MCLTTFQVKKYERKVPYIYTPCLRCNSYSAYFLLLLCYEEYLMWFVSGELVVKNAIFSYHNFWQFKMCYQLASVYIQLILQIKLCTFTTKI